MLLPPHTDPQSYTFWLQSSRSSVMLLSNTMGSNATFHFVHFHRTALADFGNVGQYTLLLHGIPTSDKCLGNRQIKIYQIPSLVISPNSSATQYNPIVKNFLGSGNLDIFCRHSGVRYCIHDLSKEHKYGFFPAYSACRTSPNQHIVSHSLHRKLHAGGWAQK